MTLPKEILNLDELLEAKPWTRFVKDQAMLLVAYAIDHIGTAIEMTQMLESGMEQWDFMQAIGKFMKPELMRVKQIDEPTEEG